MQRLKIRLAVWFDQALNARRGLQLLPCVESGEYTALGLNGCRNGKACCGQDSCADGREEHGDYNAGIDEEIDNEDDADGRGTCMMCTPGVYQSSPTVRTSKVVALSLCQARVQLLQDLGQRLPI